MSFIKKYGGLFRDFLKFGCFTFGGGLSIVAQMQSEYAEKRKIMSSEELLDLTSVARSMPGIMICNVAMLFGHRMAGFLGGCICVLGLCLPPMAILTLITTCYTIFQTNPLVMAAMSGIRAAIAPIILSAALSLTKGAYRFPPCYAVTVLAFCLYVFWGVSAIWLVVIGAVSGLLISEYYERKEKGHAVH